MARQSDGWVFAKAVSLNVDRLFDRGCISFDNSGELISSCVAHEDSMKKMGIITERVVNGGCSAEALSTLNFQQLTVRTPQRVLEQWSQRMNRSWSFVPASFRWLILLCATTIET